MADKTRGPCGIDRIDSPGMHLGQIITGMTVQTHPVVRQDRMTRCYLRVEGIRRSGSVTSGLDATLVPDRVRVPRCGVARDALLSNGTRVRPFVLGREIQ
ncbi:MAG: hypothetical protein M1617_04265 [Actinobacteria bacterium]|nr:hypothetical protein [Actinomycetota bacterium]MCL5887506.1 hypothetical protein [Actinomycetota bacterium]